MKTKKLMNTPIEKIIHGDNCIFIPTACKKCTDKFINNQIN